MAGIVLWRREWPVLCRSRVWRLVYGRRKTGKSFMLRRCRGWSLYALVTRDLQLIVVDSSGSRRITGLDEGLRLVADTASSGGWVILDEFQRLPERYWDLVSMVHPEGCLYLVASSLSVTGRVFDKRSPLLGLVEPYSVGLIPYSDVLATLSLRTSSRLAAIWSVVLRDPWVIPLLEEDLANNVKPSASLARRIHAILASSTSVVGEVFEEEGRRLTTLYESILRRLGSGDWQASRIAGALAAQGLVETASTVTGVLERMRRMGLVVKYPLVAGRRRARYIYRVSSPIIGLAYWLAARYGVDEGLHPGYNVLEKSIDSYLGLELQFSVGELLAESHDGIQAYGITGEGDIDVVILDARGRKPVIVYEVKMGECGLQDARKIVEQAARLSTESGLVCLGGVSESARRLVDYSYDADELVDLARQTSRRRIKESLEVLGHEAT